MDLQAFVNMTDFEHSRKVSELSRLLAGYMGYSGSEAELIGQAALFHDIGKCEIDPAILNKPGLLTPQEFAVIKSHTQLGGGRIKEMLDILTAACLIAETHHERWDGSGYIGLTGDQIHPYSRLVSVVDVLDALRSKRAYKNAWDMGEVFGYLEKQSGIHFDTAVVSALLAHKDEITAIYR